MIARREAEELASSVLVAGIAGEMPDARETQTLLQLEPAGVILFARNVMAEEQVRRLTTRLRTLLVDPLVLIDQEGGRVDRLRALRGRSPSLRELARDGVERVAHEASATARVLRDLGITVNCAPVLDLDDGPESNGIGDRSASSDPALVAACGRAIVRAHAAEAVATTLKHFPGLGRTGEDTHRVRPTVTASRDALDARDLVPFRLLLDEAPGVMVSHAAFPAFGDGDRPASCSRAIVTELLRRELGYEGLAVTDDLEMGAVTDWTPATRAVEALRAGQDLLLFCSDLAQLREAHDGIVRALTTEDLAASRVREAAARVRDLKRRVA